MLKISRSRSNSALAYRRMVLALALLSLISIKLISIVYADVGTGSVSLSSLGTTVTEHFDGLANTGTSSTLPTGWYFVESGTAANTTYTAGTGSSPTGDTYSFGAAASTERAFGQLRSGSVGTIIGAKFTNNTGSTINSLGISYTGEQWRVGGTHSPNPERMDFQYSTNATDLSTGTYTDFDALDFTPPITSGAGTNLDGNAAANRKFLGATITGLNIPNGATFWIHWLDADASAGEDGLAVDDFSITPLAGSIGPNGVRTTDVQGTDDGGFALALQPDGKIVVGGYAVDPVNGDKEFALVRYNYNGTLDTTFNGTGKVVTDIGTNTSDRIWGITLQSDNKIVAVGETVNPGTLNDIAIARYNSDGSLDLTFGGTGKVTTDYLLGNNSAYGVAISGTNIYVAGAATVSGNYDFMVARYTTLGVLDPTFNTLGTVPGIATTGFGGGNDIARAVAVDSSNRPVLGGYSNGGSGDDFAIARFTTAGALDTTFVAGLGKAAIDLGNNNADQAFGIAIDSAQRIILAGSTYNGTNKDFALVRYTSAGALDSGFGSGGIVTTDFANSPDVALSVYARSDNFIVAGGFSRYSSSSDDFALARYNASGALDTSFDTDGKLTMRISNADERAYGVAQEFDNKIVAAGFAAVEGSNPVTRNFALARFNSSGTLDAATLTELTRPDLIVTKSGPGQNVIAGNNFTYTISVHNQGPGDATNVTITDTLPAGLTYVSHTASTGTSNESSGTVTNNISSIKVGATDVLSITVNPGTTVGVVSNTASVTLNESDLNTNNNSSTDYTRIIGVTNMSFSPSTVVGGCQNSTGTVTLSGLAPSGGATVTLTTGDAAAANPGPSVTVPAGFNSANFTVVTGPVPSNRQVRMEATLGPTSFVRRLVVNTGNCN